MKNEQRIWNKSELEQMPEWYYNDRIERWFNDNVKFAIREDMIGKPVQWCKDQGYTVTPEMIAKTETELVQEAVTQMGDKLQERLDKGEIGITLENGTTIKVGGKYKRLAWEDNSFVKIVAFGEKCFLGLNEDNEDYFGDIISDWLPYTEPKEEQKPLEGYKLYYVLYKTGIVAKYMNDLEKQNQGKNIIAIYTPQEAISLGLTI